jgi:hypothetical protein
VRDVTGVSGTRDESFATADRIRPSIRNGTVGWRPMDCGLDEFARDKTALYLASLRATEDLPEHRGE